MSEEQLHPQINVAVRRWSCLPWSCNMELLPSVCEAQLWKKKHPTRLFTLLFTWFFFFFETHLYLWFTTAADKVPPLSLSPVSGPYQMEIVKRGRKWSAITHSSLILRQTRYRSNLKPQESFAACLTASESDCFAVTTFSHLKQTGNLLRSNELQCSGSIWISAPPPPSARYCTSTVSVSLSVIWPCPCAACWNRDQKKSLNSSEVALRSIFRVTLMLETIPVIISPCLWSFGRELVQSWHLLVSSPCPSSIYRRDIDNKCKKQHI